MSIGERITELRKVQKLSQGQLAEMLHISRQAVSKWENDVTMPDSENLIRLADILDTDIEYLSTGRRNMSRRPPVILETVNTVEVEKRVEIPVIQVVEKIVEKPVIEFVEKPVVKRVYRKKYVRNPLELFLVGSVCLIIGILIGLLI